MTHWDGAQGQAKMAKITQNTPTCDVPPRESQTQNEKIFFFDFDYKICWSRRGYEQLSSSSGWRIMAKKGPANILAREVVKGLVVLCCILRIKCPKLA